MKSFLNKLSRYKAIPICIVIILLSARLFLAYLEKRKGLYLEHDYFYNVINYLMLISALFIYFQSKKIRWAYWLVLLFFIIANTMGIYKSISNVQFQNSFINGDNSFIVRETKDESNFSLVYERRHRIFIYLVDKIGVKDGYKPFYNNNYEVSWINNEKAMIKYSYGNSHKAKGEILNFTKVNGPYSNVIGSLEGAWTDKNNNKNTFTIDRGQITFKIGSKIYWFSSTMADEQGNYGSILYGANDTPTLYILKNDDNTITIGYVEPNNNVRYIYEHNKG